METTELVTGKRGAIRTGPGIDPPRPEGNAAHTLEMLDSRVCRVSNQT